MEELITWILNQLMLKLTELLNLLTRTSLLSPHNETHQTAICTFWSKAQTHPQTQKQKHETEDVCRRAGCLAIDHDPTAYWPPITQAVVNTLRPN